MALDKGEVNPVTNVKDMINVSYSNRKAEVAKMPNISQSGFENWLQLIVMENYKVEQFTDNIIVWYSDKEFIRVNQRFDWKGKLTSSFIKNGICILETTYDIFMFRKFISVKNQNLPHIFSLLKKRGVFYLRCNGNILALQRQYLKNPIYILLNNNLNIGKVNSKLTGLIATPIIFDLTFYEEDDANFYSLLRFLMELPPTMDV